MMKEGGKQKGVKKKRSRPWILVAVFVLLLGLGIAIYTSITDRRAASEAHSLTTITLSKTEIANTISVSGQVDSSNVTNIYSLLLNYPVEEVLVEIGDRVEKGDTLARIDTKSLEYDINQAKNNLKNAQKTLETEKQNNQNSIVNAQNALNSVTVSLERQLLAYEKSLVDLKEAEEAVTKPFDSYTYDNVIIEAKVTLDKKIADLAEAEHKLNSEKYAFDAYTYNNLINDARIKLDRTMADLEKAINDGNSGTLYFDSSTYDFAINAAQVTVDRTQTDYNEALRTNNNDPTATAVVAKKRALEDAQAALNKAYNDRYKAQSDFYDANQSAQDTADAKVTAARNAVDDAQRAYDKALEDLDRAYDKAVEDATKKVETAKLSLSDAQRAYDKAVTDLQKAKDKAAEDNPLQLSTAQRNAADAEKSLESAQLSVANAQNNLNQAKSRVLTSESNVANQKISLDKLLDQLANAEITASESGTITVVNAKEGVNPSGILFTIEDTNQLYVTARVKEYNLKDLSIGQNILITTDATDEEVFEGDIIYISPKAVSEAGSTNVEFEIWVEIKNPNENIKIGMNAFLEIIIAAKKDVYVVPLSAIITNENGTFIRSQSGDGTTDVPVVIGITTSTSAEISGEGVENGLIILSAPNVN
jgi:HlyD family secretion protein